MTVDAPSVDSAAPGLAGGHHVVITADSHAGASHAQYREFLESEYLEDFDAWRNRYQNPYRDLAPGDDRRLRNWDNDMRNSQQDADGVVGEVIFPNTVPPFFPGFVLFAPPPNPEDYEHRLAGIRAHNRWLVDFCAQFPNRRVGLGQIFLNDVDDAIADAKWIKQNGLKGILIPPVPPDAHGYIRPLNDPEYDRLWAVCEDLDIPLHTHGGTGSPAYPRFPSSTILHISELGFYSQRTLVWMILAGVFERFPRLKLVLTEQGCFWLQEMGQRLDGLIRNVKQGSQGELRFTADMAPPRMASEYIHDNVYLGVSMAGPWDVASRNVVAEGHWMWGSDYPHDEGTYPFSKEHLRVSMQGLSPEERNQLLAGNAAALYGFDLGALAGEAERFGPSVTELDTPLEQLPDGANQALAGLFSGTRDPRRQMMVD
ncbi:MAG TPA: amidohydrolase family protein [Acidimicrobiales bacterium]|nr:amidohydrolase family protein [Acidimicrobiales bacterium]